jgi:hypothetical protein
MPVTHLVVGANRGIGVGLVKDFVHPFRPQWYMLIGADKEASHWCGVRNESGCGQLHGTRRTYPQDEWPGHCPSTRRQSRFIRLTLKLVQPVALIRLTMALSGTISVAEPAARVLKVIDKLDPFMTAQGILSYDGSIIPC